MKSRSEIKNEAKKILKGNVWKLFLPILLSILIPSLLILTITKTFNIQTETISYSDGMTQKTTAGNLLDLIQSILSSVLMFSASYFVLSFIRKNDITISEMFNYLCKNCLLLLITSIVVSFFTILGSMFFIIPGLIIFLGLSMVAYIVADNQNIKTMEAIKQSWNLTKGHKGEIFVYGLSFFGWALLCVFIFPIIYVVPYMNVTMALYYEELKEQNNI